MVRLVHHALHVPADARAALAAARTPVTEWPGTTTLADGLVVLPVVPAGLTSSSSEWVALAIQPGVVAAWDDEVLHRLRLEVPGRIPTVRGDLTVRAATGHGVRLRFSGEFRGSGGATTQQEADAVESIVQPLVHHLASFVLEAWPGAPLR